jgi:vacuolar-type H+-ATPase subunit B/Vma2
VSTRTSAHEAVVTGVNGNIVSIDAGGEPVMQNEIGYICVNGQRLKAEVLRVHGRAGELQVFEDTQGVHVGDRVELTGEMLSVTLGPGLLGTLYDGLQLKKAAAVSMCSPTRISGNSSPYCVTPMTPWASSTTSSTRARSSFT